MFHELLPGEPFQLADSIPQLVAIADLTGEIRYMNRHWEVYTGVARSAAMGWGWSELVHDDDAGRLVDGWIRATKTGEDFEGEFRLRRHDGAYRWHLSRLSAVRDDSGRIMSWFGTSVDIHQQKRTAEGLRFMSEAVPDILWTTDQHGAAQFVNQRWVEFTGLSREASRGSGWLQAIHPDDRGASIAAWHSAIGERRPYENFQRYRRHDGGYRWFLVRGQPATDADGNLIAWFGTSTDIDDQKRMEFDLRASESRFRSLAEAAPTFAWSADKDGAITYIGPQWAEYCGVDPELAAEGRWSRWVHPDDLISAERAWAHSVATGEPYEVIGRRWCATSHAYRSMMSRALPVHDADGEIVQWVGTTVDINEHVRNAAFARTEAEAASLFARERDRDVALPQVAAIAIGGFGDACGIYLRGNHVPVLAWQAAAPSAGAELREAVRGRLAANLAQQAVSEGRSALAYEDRPLASIGRQEVPVAVLAVPLLGPAREPRGALVLACAGTYDWQDMRAAETFAERVGLFMENAALLSQAQSVADRFQHAALPTALPHIDGFAFDAFYRPAARHALVGGDWYDALRLADGRVVVSVGDVSGNGLSAAVIMSSVRQSIRAIAHVDPNPSLILNAADRALRAEYPDTYVTAWVGVIDRVAGSLNFDSAGHPPAMLRRHDGTIDLLSGRGAPLGLRERFSEATVSVELPEDGLLVLYTDGLTEAGRDPVRGERMLLDALDADLSTAEHPAHAIAANFVENEPHDDVAVLTVAIGAGCRPPAAAGRLASWRFDVGERREADAVREAIVERLEAGGADADETLAAEIVYSELIANALRYAPGRVDVKLDTRERLPVLHVVDAGPGFQVVANLPSDVMSERGRGLFIVASLTEDFHVEQLRRGGSHARAVLRVRSWSAAGENAA